MVREPKQRKPKKYRMKGFRVTYMQPKAEKEAVKKAFEELKRGEKRRA